MIPDRVTLFLAALPLGLVLRKVIVFLLWVLTGLMIFTGLYLFIDQAMSLGQAPDPVAVIGAIISMLVIIAGTAAIAVLLLYRIQDIEFLNLQNYPVIKFNAHLLRMVGEILVVAYVIFGLTTGISIWFGNQALALSSGLLLTLPFATFPSFVSGLLTIICSIFQAALALIVSYLGAELLLLLRDLANRRR